MIILSQRYRGMPAGYRMDCGSGVAELLVARGIANWEKTNEQNLRCDDGANSRTIDAERAEDSPPDSIVRFRHGTESNPDSQPQNRRRGRPPKIRDTNG